MCKRNHPSCQPKSWRVPTKGCEVLMLPVWLQEELDPWELETEETEPPSPSF